MTDLHVLRLDTGNGSNRKDGKRRGGKHGETSGRASRQEEGKSSVSKVRETLEARLGKLNRCRDLCSLHRLSRGGKGAHAFFPIPAYNL